MSFFNVCARGVHIDLSGCWDDEFQLGGRSIVYRHDKEMVLEKANRYEFGLDHYDNVNFEHYLELDLVCMVSLKKNFEHTQYDCLSLMKGDEKSWEETLPL